MSFLSDIYLSAKGLAKVALLSRRPSLSRKVDAGTIYILGNGPSLADAIQTHGEMLANSTTMAVNFAANTPEFTRLHPRYYILADPHFFGPKGSDPNVDRLWDNLNAVRHDVTLIVPMKMTKQARQHISNPRVRIEGFNPVGVEGFMPLRHGLYGAGLAMPRPRNVLIPAIMCAILMGYREIVLLGADHSWMSTLSVDDDNRVVSIQPHFYADNADEKARVASVYGDIRLHSIVESFAIAFRAYHLIADFARSRGVEIVNATPGSMIDAFPRRKL